MLALKKHERAAIDAVARRFAATWETGVDPHDAYLTVGGKRIAVEVATFTRRGAGQSIAAKPRLRFDKVVIRLMERLQAALGTIVPDGMTVALTVTAPIRLPGKTAEALEDKIQKLVGRKSPAQDQKATIHGNRVRIRLLGDASKRTPKLIGFVHNANSEAPLLLDMTRELLALLKPETGRRTRSGSADRWLVVASARASSGLDTYRYIYSQLRMQTAFKKILMVFGDGRVGMLTD